MICFMFFLHMSSSENKWQVEPCEPDVLQYSLFSIKDWIQTKEGTVSAQLSHYENIGQSLQIILNLHINAHHCFGVRTVRPGPGKTKQTRVPWRSFRFPLTVAGD